jgi:hypothetical protein
MEKHQETKQKNACDVFNRFELTNSFVTRQKRTVNERESFYQKTVQLLWINIALN